MIPSAPIFPLSLSNSLSFASIPIVKIGKNYENFNFQTLNPFSQWRAALTFFSFSRYFLKKSSFFSTKKIQVCGSSPSVFWPKIPYLLIFFRWQNICWKIFAVCQLLKKDWDVFVQKWAHTDFLLLNICISYNAMA